MPLTKEQVEAVRDDVVAGKQNNQLKASIVTALTQLAASLVPVPDVPPADFGGVDEPAPVEDEEFPTALEEDTEEILADEDEHFDEDVHEDEDDEELVDDGDALTPPASKKKK